MEERMKILLKNGMVVSGNGSKKQDVLIQDGIIMEVSDSILASDAEQVDVTGKILFPGFIDAHTHFDLEVSNTVTADNFATGTKAAILGGTTMIIDFATQNKGETLTEALQNWHKKADGVSSCDYGFHMAISDWNAQTEKDLSVMFEQGVSSFKLYMTYPAMRVDDGVLYECLKKISKMGGLVGVHCENGDVIDALIAEQKAAGNNTPCAHPISRPSAVEAEAIHRLLTIAKLAGAAVMVVHLSSKEGLEEVLRAEDQTVFAETCPQYLLLDDSVYCQETMEAAKYVCSPPLRKKIDQDALWDALKNDQIHTIATDHCSFSMEQKSVGREDFTKIPNGMPGVETRGSLLYTYGYRSGKLSLEQLCRLLSENPAKLYGLYPRKGVIRPGSDADIVVFDPEKETIISAKTHHYHMDYAPFEGWKLHGDVQDVYLRGELIVKNGTIQKENFGQYIKREKGSFL